MPARPSSPRSRPSRRRAAAPVLVDVSEDDYGLDRRRRSTPRSTDADAVRDAGSPLRPAGGHAAAARARGAARPRRRRGRLPGARRRARRRRAPGRPASRGRLQLLPGQEPRRDGRRGRSSTDDADLAARVRALREHGQTRKYDHEREGYTARLDTIQAVVLLQQAPAPRRRGTRSGAPLAALYHERLAGVGDLGLPPVAARQRARVAPLRRPDGRPGAARRAPRRARNRDGPSLPDAAAPDAAPTRPSATGRARSRSPRRSRGQCLSLPIFPGITEAQVERSSARCVDFFARG